MIRDMQIKTTMRYSLMPVRKAILKSQETTDAGKVARNTNTFRLLVGMYIHSTIVEDSVYFSKI